ncbi:MAG: hypothetical protein PVF45_08845, partial [Anaerolineae bacterium]
MFKKKAFLLALFIALGAMVVLVNAAPLEPLERWGADSIEAEVCPVGDEYETAGGGDRDDSF